MKTVLKVVRNQPDLAEIAFVASVLFISAQLGGGKLSDWLSAIAVLLSFVCTQAAFDLAEHNRSIQSGARLCRRYRTIYIAKEFFWILTCLVLQNYPLIASTAVFATYPFWRRERIAESPAGSSSDLLLAQKQPALEAL